ncbi:MAG: hypothetical protein C0506_08200 [Anaerolinea sp.]|nr:hypothetical protein [Anaerolinea sp.]
MDVHDAAIQHVNRAWEWFGGMVALSATNLGVELGLFDAIRDQGPITSTDLAARLQLQPRAVDTWAKVLVHNGLLVDAGDEELALAPGVELMVCEPRTLFHLGPSFAYHGRFLARDFLDLAEYFREGVPQPPARHGAPLSRNIAEQTAMMHAVFAGGMLPELPEVAARLERGCRVLDAGCGAANLGIVLCSMYEGLTYTGIDSDEAAVAEAGRAIRANGLSGRARVFAGDVATFPLDNGYGLATLFLSFHEIPPADREATLRAVHSALGPEGVLFIFDEMYPATLSEAAESSSRMGLHFEYTEMLWGSRVPTVSELDELLRKAGFAGAERRPLMGGAVHAVIARKG